jgi:hypothetical protein
MGLAKRDVQNWARFGMATLVSILAQMFIYRKIPSSWGGDICQYCMRKKYENGEEKRGKCKRKSKNGERKSENGK